jgi:hypothetical protein
MVIHYASLAKGSSVWITAQEVERCRGIAETRSAAGRRIAARGSCNAKKYSTQSQEAIEMQGVIGEAALNKLLDLDMETFFTSPNRVGSAHYKTDTHDLLGFVDVKCPNLTGTPSTFWVTQNKRNNPAAYYALVTIMERRGGDGGECRVVFWGAARSSWVFSDENLIHNKSGAFYEVDVAALEPLTVEIVDGVVEPWKPETPAVVAEPAVASSSSP